MAKKREMDEFDLQERATFLRNATTCIMGAIIFCSLSFFLFAAISVVVQPFGGSRVDLKFRSILGDSIIGWTGYYCALSAFCAVMLSGAWMIVSYISANAEDQIRATAREFKDWFSIGIAGAFTMVSGVFLLNVAV